MRSRLQAKTDLNGAVAVAVTFEDAPEKYAIGIDIGGTKVRTGLIDLEGRILAARTMPSEFTPHASENAHRLAVEAIAVAADAGMAVEETCGVCLGVPGIVDVNNGRILSCPNARELEGAGLLEAIGAELGKIDVWIENDVDMAAVAEGWVGAGAGVRNLLFVAVGTGIGLGIIADGKLYRGTGGAGEGGHMVIAETGPICVCGSRGCLEALGSGRAIEAAYTAGHGGRECVMSGGSITYDISAPVSISARQVLQRACNEDGIAVRVVEDAAYYLGVGIANLINLFAPELVAIGGGLGIGEWKFLRPRIEEVCNARVRVGIRNTALIAESRLGVDAGILGCGKRVLDRS